MFNFLYHKNHWIRRALEAFFLLFMWTLSHDFTVATVCKALVTSECFYLRKKQIRAHLWFALLITIQLISENLITGQTNNPKTIARMTSMQKGIQTDNVRLLCAEMTSLLAPMRPFCLNTMWLQIILILWNVPDKQCTLCFSEKKKTNNCQLFCTEIGSCSICLLSFSAGNKTVHKEDQLTSSKDALTLIV